MILRRSFHFILLAPLFFTVHSDSCRAQGTAQDYQRAEQFLGGNLRHHAYIADVTPHWISKTNRFWYSKTSQTGTEFLLVDPAQSETKPAFDHARLAAALTASTKRDIKPMHLPFDSFEFSDDGKSIHFRIDETEWHCTLESYECKSDPIDGGKAADGTTDLYGLIWRPSNFDPSKKYPIIEMVYTGPQGFLVPKTFSGTLRVQQQTIAELGFITVMVDGRGTTGRSRAFHEFSYRNLGGSFEDHVAVIKQMATQYPYMDIDRVGIYGTSAGGYGSAHAMLAFPDFYKVGVSISGDHDARLDKAWWNELYQGYPLGPDYVEQSNVTMANRLKGHLLLVHGDIDDNVHVVETMRFADALMKANKNFDMLIVPNMYHGEGGNLYLVRRRWDYFVQNLLGVTPPAGYEIHEDRENLPRRQH